MSDGYPSNIIPERADRKRYDNGFFLQQAFFLCFPQESRRFIPYFCRKEGARGVYFSGFTVYNYLDKVESPNYDLERRDEKEDPLSDP